MPEKDVKKDFIHENIVHQDNNKRKNIIRHLAITACSALVFGLVAAAAFAFAEPKLSKRFFGDNAVNSSNISIPKDEPESAENSEEASSSPNVQDEAAKESEALKESELAKETKPVDEVVRSMFAEYEYTSEDIKKFYSRFDEICRKFDSSLVSVDSVKNARDWFNNPVEKEGHYSGVVLSKTETEVVILCPAAALGEADLIKVIFGDSSENNAVLKAVDKISGLAVIYVPTAEINPSILEAIEPAVLGNSYQVTRGNTVIAVGSPLGLSRSVSYGYVSHIAKDISVADGTARLFYSDLKTDAEAGSFIINLDGEIIAWATDNYENRNGTGISIAYAISDYKELIEKMINGEAVQYIGVEAVNVSNKMKESGMPGGIYVGTVVSGSPVYNSGIQTGDIIKALNGQEITNINSYIKLLNELSIGNDVIITVMRNNGKDEYKELKFNIKTGERLLRKGN